MEALDFFDMPGKNSILWDFDGTLGYRPGMWSQVLVDVLMEQQPACSITVEDMRPLLREGFPWHRPDLPHTHITTPEAWWTDIERLLARTYVAVGCPISQAEHFAQLAHQKYLDSSGWFLYEDVIPTLSELQREGWEHVLLSNHVPELPLIVDALGLTPYIVTIFTSASMGYEKPHPAAFLSVLEYLGKVQTVWMVGDSFEADILGAEMVGIPGILVRKEDTRAKCCCPDLYELPSLLRPGCLK